MREIKFRAWVKKDYDGHGIADYMEGDASCFNDPFEEHKHGNIVLMQYTGLKDKNGVEIYEGDILKFDDMGEDGYEYSEGFDFENSASVCFKNGRFELENFRSNNSGVLNEMNQEDHETFIAIFIQSKIVGNIYEHPHLLEVSE